MLFLIALGQLLKQVRQIGKRVQPVLFGRFDEAVDCCAGRSPARGIGKLPILPPDHERFNGTFTAVIVDLQTPVF